VKHAVLGRFLETLAAGRVRHVHVDLVTAGTTAEDGGRTLTELVGALDPASIEELELLHTFMPSPPPRLFELASLTTLRLTHAPRLTALTPPVLATISLATVLPALTTLDLSGCEALEALPADVLALCALTTLTLAHCIRLERLPDLPPLADDAAPPMADDTEAPDGESPPAAPAVPRGFHSRLQLLDVTGCKRLAYLPDLSSLVGLEVRLEGCVSELTEGYMRNGRKALDVGYAID